MPSPFPGMDPYIESREIWSDFHHDLAGELRADLNQKVQPKYYATAVTYAAYDVIEVTKPESHFIVPDSSVWSRGNVPQRSGTVAVLDAPLAPPIDAPPIQNVVEVEIAVRLANVEVRQTGTNSLVTSIEILSPINKRSGREREKYLRKRRELLRSDVHVMEIDLLRAGERSPLTVAPPAAPYYITLARANQRPFVDVWPIQLVDRLPVLPIPLLSPDKDIALDIGAIVRAIYERGAYAARIDYQQAVPPPLLEATQQAWVAQLLRNTSIS